MRRSKDSPQSPEKSAGNPNFDPTPTQGSLKLSATFLETRCGRPAFDLVQPPSSHHWLGDRRRIPGGRLAVPSFKFRQSEIHRHTASRGSRLILFSRSLIACLANGRRSCNSGFRLSSTEQNHDLTYRGTLKKRIKSSGWILV